MVFWQWSSEFPKQRRKERDYFRAQGRRSLEQGSGGVTITLCFSSSSFFFFFFFFSTMTPDINYMQLLVTNAMLEIRETISLPHARLEREGALSRGDVTSNCRSALPRTGLLLQAGESGCDSSSATAPVARISVRYLGFRFSYLLPRTRILYRMWLSGFSVP